MDGTVTQLKSEVGERVVGTAMMAGTEIMTLAKLDAMEAWVDIGEVDIVLIQRGQQARLEVDAYRDRVFSGKVTEIANAAKTSGAGTQQEAVRFEVKIRVHETERVRPGMSVTADIETRHRTNVLTVPIQSVTSRVPPSDWNSSPDPSSSTNTEPGSARTASDGEAPSDSATGSGSDAPLRKPVEVVFTVQDGVARMRAVERGISDDTHTEITSGLEEGMEVVSGGYRAISRDLEDGARVRLGGPVVETSDD
jgi:HlyD family secretion protein